MGSGGIIANDVGYDPTMSPNQENLITTNILFLFCESNLPCDDPLQRTGVVLVKCNM
jgi:hypothetical protein